MDEGCEAGSQLENAVGGLGGLRRDPDRWLAAASDTALESDRLRRRLSRFLDKDGHAKIHSSAGLKYPDGDFARRLQALAAMLGAGFPIRTVAVTAPGSYDTHAEEAGALADGLKQVAATLVVFQQDLEARQLGGRVLTLVWTEFGRRAAENGSRGTDHGAAGVAFGALALAVASPAGSAARAPARVQVVEREYTLTLSRLSLRSGPAIVNVVNFGQDAHNLVLVRKARGAKPARTQVVPPHAYAELDVRLVPGRYELYCSLPGHRAAGMRASLTVRR